MKMPEGLGRDAERKGAESMKDFLHKIKDFFNGLFDKFGKKSCFVAGIFVGVLITVLLLGV